MRIYETLDSTNKEAARLIATGEHLHGTGILAFEQSDGLGQYGRRWHSAPGLHLALTVILQPQEMKIEELAQLSMKISLAVVRALQEIAPAIKAQIKWPNDIYADGKKLAGILIENSISGTRVQHCIIGIGMNVNETYFPESIPNAISLHMLTGDNYDIKTVAEKLQSNVLTIYNQPFSDWKDEYDERLFGRNKDQWFEMEGRKVKAKVIDVDGEGKMVIEYNGITSAFYTHQLKWIL